MEKMRIFTITSKSAVLCLACALLLSAVEAHSSSVYSSLNRQSARSRLHTPLAMPLLGGCVGQVVYGQPVRGTIEPGNESCFRFQGAAGDVVTVRMTRLSGNLDPLLKLWSGDRLLASDDDSGGDRNSLIANFTLPTSDSYALVASGFDASSSGSFELLLTLGPSRPTPLPLPTPAAPPACGGMIEYGDTVEEYLRLGAVCRYVFEGQEGDTIAITMSSLNNQLDSKLDLVDPEGKLVESDDDSAGDRNSRIIHRLLHSGTYTILASSYADSSMGRYELTLSEPCNACGGYTPIVPPPSPCGGAIEYGQQIGDSIDKNARACTYTFDGRRDELVTLRADAISVDLDPVIDLYAPSDSLQPMISNDDAYGSNSAIWRFRLTEDGPYQAVVHAYQDRSSGDFQLLLTQGIFRRNDQVELLCPETMNIRRTPGRINKPANDVLAQVASGTVMTVISGPKVVDGLRWWRLEYRSPSSRLITGWMAEALETGQFVLAPAFQP